MKRKDAGGRAWRENGIALRAARVFALVAVASCASGPRASQPAEPAPPMLTRAEWGSRPPVLPMRAHAPRRITIHHTGVRSDTTRALVAKLQGLQQWSQRDDSLAGGRRKPAWPDIPYHYYIDIRGQIAEARDVNYVGDTNTEYDPSGHILVVVEGNFEVEQPNDAQLAALRVTTRWLARTWRVPSDSIAAHRDFARTTCPGRSLYAYIGELRTFVAGR